MTSAVAGNIGVYYSYDALGRKIERLDGDGGYEYYFHDGNQIVADFDGNEWRVIRSYTYGPGIDNILSMTVHGSTSTNTYYYLKDLSNTVLSLVNDNGIAVEYYEYDAYGNVTIRNESGTVISTSAYGNRYLFQGREYDYTTQLYHFRARWYDPETGRWLSNDPIGISGGLNLYAFCSNDPVNFVDPMGLDVWVIVDGRSAISVGHEYVVGNNGNGGYWHADKNFESGVLPLLAGLSIGTKSVKNYVPESDNFNPSKPGYTILRHVVTTDEVDRILQEEVKKWQNDPNIDNYYQAEFDNCRKFANGIADRAEYLMDNLYPPYRPSPQEWRNIMNIPSF